MFTLRSWGAGMSDENHASRIDRVEGDVSSIRGEISALARDVGTVQSDVKGLGAILGRIEQGVVRSQEKSEEKADRAKPNLIAVISILITVISILIGGAWTIGAALARSDERDIQRTRELDVATQFRNREADRLEDQMTRSNERSFRNAGKNKGDATE